MSLLEWRLTLLALLVLPLFIIPAKRVGRRLQTITRERMNLNAAMNTHDDRAVQRVAARCSSSCSADHDDEAATFVDRAGRVRDIGVRSAMYGRVFFVALGLVGAVGTAVVYWLGGQLVISGHDHARHARRPGRLRQRGSTTRSPASPTPGSTS